VRGYLYIAAAALLWGIAATLGRAAFTGKLLAAAALRPIDPLILSQARATLSLAFLLPILLIRRPWRALLVPKRDLIRLALLGVFGVAASNYFYYVGIQRTSVATAIILQYTAPVWVLIYSIVRGGGRPSLRRTVAVGLSVVGCGLVVGLAGTSGLRLDLIGVLAAILAAFCFSFYNIGGHGILARYNRWLVLLWVLVWASAFWLVVNPPWRVFAAHYGREQWAFMLLFALLSVLGPFSCYFAGLQYLEPTRAVVVSCLEPVFCIVLAAAVLGEFLGPLQTLGIVIVLGAIVLIQIPERATKQEEVVVEPIE